MKNALLMMPLGITIIGYFLTISSVAYIKFYMEKYGVYLTELGVINKATDKPVDDNGLVLLFFGVFVIPPILNVLSLAWCIGDIKNNINTQPVNIAFGLNILYFLFVGYFLIA